MINPNDPVLSPETIANCERDTACVVIKTKEDINKIRANLAGTYVQGANIDFNGVDFEPIGFDEYGYTYFTGSFNGNGFTISGLKIQKKTENNIGLENNIGFFSKISGATILNVILHLASVAGDEYVGALVGRADNQSVINDSHVRYIGDAIRGNRFVGGLVGYLASGGSIENSSVEHNGLVKCISPRSECNVGGLVGYSAGAIKNSFAKINVEGNKDNLGGLVGFMANNGTIDNSYFSERQVESNGGDNLGGLVGYNHGTINDSYVESGKIIDNRISDEFTFLLHFGGLVGQNTSTGNINRSYFKGTLEIKGVNVNNGIVTFIGGLVGNNDGNINYSYAEGALQVESNYLFSNSSSISSMGGLVGGNGGDITYSYFKGTLEAKGDISSMGGLVGNNSENITYSYALATIKGDKEANSVGGLVGNNSANATINNSYSHSDFIFTGDVRDIGGLVGYNGSTAVGTAYAVSSMKLASGDIIGAIFGYFGQSTIPRNVFGHAEVSLETSPSDSGIRGKTAAALKDPDTFLAAGWDAAIWLFQNGEYPTLRWQQN